MPENESGGSYPKAKRVRVFELHEDGGRIIMWAAGGVVKLLLEEIPRSSILASLDPSGVANVSVDIPPDTAQEVGLALGSVKQEADQQ